MGFGALRVLNDDAIAPGTGFGAHAHRDMEILTIVTRGAVTHTDSMGNTESVPVGDVQVMSAGTGVKHAEVNASQSELLTLFQLWIEPNEKGITPQYAQRSFDLADQAPGLVLLAGPADADALPIHQDAFISHGVIDRELIYELRDESHGVYLFVIEGSMTVNDATLAPRDGMGIAGTSHISIASEQGASFLLIEVPLS